MSLREHIDSNCRAVRSAVLASMLAAALMPAPALAEFGPPVTLSRASPIAADPQVAINAGGDALIVWSWRDRDNKSRIQARARSATGVLGPIRTLSPAGQNAYDPQVAIEADGDALVVWHWRDLALSRIQARARSATGVLGPVRTLSYIRDYGWTPQVAIDADGDALVVWRLYDGVGEERIQARTRSAAGVYGRVRNLSRADQNAYDPQVAMNADGEALVVWRLPEGRSNRIQARARSAAGAYGPIRTLSRAGESADEHQVAMDADGDALIVWRRYDFDQRNYRIEARTRSAAGVYGRVRMLSRPGSAKNPQVAIDADGDALVVWQRSDGLHVRIQARARSAAGNYGRIRTLSRAGQYADTPQVAIDPNGDAVIVWRRRDEAYDERIQARTRSTADRYGPIQTLSRRGHSGFAPQVAIGPDGDALVVWQLYNGTNYGIQAAAGP